MKGNYLNKNGGLIKWIILIVVAILILSYFGVDIKNFFMSDQVHKNFGYIWNFIKGIWNNYLIAPAHLVWGIFLQYVWDPFLNVINK